MKWWSRIWFILTLKCDQASLLQSDALDRPLLFYERFALRGHFFVCHVCRKLRRQLTFLDTANRNAGEPLEREDCCTLPDSATARIQERLREELTNDG